MTKDVGTGPNQSDPDKSDLNWISDEWQKRVRLKRNERKKFEVVLHKILLKILRKANKLNGDLSKFFVIGNQAGQIEVGEKWWTKMLHRKSPGKYILRLFLNQEKFSKFKSFEVTQCHTGPSCRDRAVVRLHKALIQEERQRLRSVMRGCMDETSDSLIPDRISAWLIPAIKKVVHKMKSLHIQGHHVVISVDHTTQGFFLTLTSSLEGDESKPTVITIEFQLAVAVHDLPKSVKIPNPYGANSLDTTKGRRVVSQIRKHFTQEKLTFVLYSPMPNIIKMPKIHSRKLPRLARMIVDYNEDLDSIDKAWLMDIECIELALYKAIKSETNAQLCLQSLNLYNALTCIDTESMPRLNKRTKLSLVLWIFKKHGHRRLGKKTMLLKVLNILDNCIEQELFPSFVRPSLSTMSIPKTSDKDSLLDTDEEFDTVGNENSEELDNDLSGEVGNSLGSSRTNSSEHTDWMSNLHAEIMQGKSFLSVLTDLVKSNQTSLLIQLFKHSSGSIKSW